MECDLDGTYEVVCGGPVTTLKFLYLGVMKEVEACEEHHKYYDAALIEFDLVAAPSKVLRYSNDMIDAHNQAWDVKKIRYWLRMQGIEVADRARLQKARHIAPWREAADADKGLLTKVTAAIAAEEKAEKKARAREALQRKVDPGLQKKVEQRVQQQRARKRLEESGEAQH